MVRFLPALLLTAVIAAQSPPQAVISNREIRATLLLPDPENGYYRGTRFDWSGVISSLKYRGHEYFGQWFERYDPKLHDAIQGPVEEFLSGDTSAGYEEARPGDTFLRIGVGAVRKPQERAYARFNTYEIVDGGKWIVRPEKDRVTFTHTLAANGYGYEYTKVVRLETNKAELVIEHRLRNTGRKTIETSQYNHNFFVIDGAPTGPAFRVLFPFDLKARAPLRGAEVRGGELTFPAELEKGQAVFTEFDGSPSARDYDIRIENSKNRAAVRIRGDQPLEKVVFWSIRTTLCPEPYVHLNVEPGRQQKWTLRYEFYELK